MDWSSRISPPVRRTSAATTRAERQLHHVARHQFGRRQRFPCAVAPDGRIQRQPRLQRGKGRLGAALLEQPECGVEDQQGGDDRAPRRICRAPARARSPPRASRAPAPRIFRAPCATDAAPYRAPRSGRISPAAGALRRSSGRSADHRLLPPPRTEVLHHALRQSCVLPRSCILIRDPMHFRAILLTGISHA